MLSPWSDPPGVWGSRVVLFSLQVPQTRFTQELLCGQFKGPQIFSVSQPKGRLRPSFGARLIGPPFPPAEMLPGALSRQLSRGSRAAEHLPETLNFPLGLLASGCCRCSPWPGA